MAGDDETKLLDVIADTFDGVTRYLLLGDYATAKRVGLLGATVVLKSGQYRFAIAMQKVMAWRICRAAIVVIGFAYILPTSLIGAAWLLAKELIDSLRK